VRKERRQTGDENRHEEEKYPPEHGGNLKGNLDKEPFLVPSFFTFPFFPIFSVVSLTHLSSNFILSTIAAVFFFVF
jgi:hypothetical protein